MKRSAMLGALAAEDGRVLAGGQSLVPIMAFRLAKPAHLIDINEIAELGRIANDGKTLPIGALVRHAAFHKPVVDNPLGALLTTVARSIAHYPIRLRGTFCGSLAHADPSAEWCLLAATLEATMVAHSTRGTRTIAARDFFQGIMSTALAEDELLGEVRLPLLAPDTRVGFNEFSRRAGDFAMSAALVTYRLVDGTSTDVHVGVGGAEPFPRRIPQAEAALNGKRRAMRSSASPPRPRPTRSTPWRITRLPPTTAATWCARWCGARWSRAHDPEKWAPVFG